MEQVAQVMGKDLCLCVLRRHEPLKTERHMQQCSCFIDIHLSCCICISVLTFFIIKVLFFTQADPVYNVFYRRTKALLQTGTLGEVCRFL